MLGDGGLPLGFALTEGEVSVAPPPGALITEWDMTEPDTGTELSCTDYNEP